MKKAIFLRLFSHIFVKMLDFQTIKYLIINYLVILG